MVSKISNGIAHQKCTVYELVANLNSRKCAILLLSPKCNDFHKNNSVKKRLWVKNAFAVTCQEYTAKEQEPELCSIKYPNLHLSPRNVIGRFSIKVVPLEQL